MENIYANIAARTGGNIYIGVVGPVRTGKSTLIKRIMEELVIPNIDDPHRRERARDELPQSASGKTIMTSEPKFVPEEAVEISPDGINRLRIRMIDSVGYMVDGAVGALEDGKPRMVTTPWYDYEIPFAKAAHVGTKKVMTDHATIGVIITGDGSYGELERAQFYPVEKQLVDEMKMLGKPFIVILNSTRPGSREVQDLAQDLTTQYGVKVLPVNCDQLRANDIVEIMKNILLEFPLNQIHFFIPKWAETLEYEHPIKQAVIAYAKEILFRCDGMKNMYQLPLCESEYISEANMSKMDMKQGIAHIHIHIPDKYYYEMLSNLFGVTVENEYDFLKIIKDVADKRKAYEHVADAMECVQMKGYGLVMPSKENITLEEPELIKHGNKYGIKIKANAPSLHFIKANVSTEIAPIVGTQEQATDFLANMKEQLKTAPESLWKINIFGKTVEQMVEEGLLSKSNKINDDSQIRLQDTMEKIINDSNGGMVFIII